MAIVKCVPLVLQVTQVAEPDINKIILSEIVLATLNNYFVWKYSISRHLE